MKNTIIFLILSLLLGQRLALAYQDPYDKYRKNQEDTYEYDDSQHKPWRESKDKIPPLPDAGAMLEVVIDGLDEEFTVFIDPATLSIGPDRVVRYWVNVRSKLGAENTMYEGLRCTTHEYKTYAYGSKKSQGGFKAMESELWQTTRAVRGRGFRHELDNQYFCDFGNPRPVPEILQRIKNGRRGLMTGPGSAGPSSFY